MRASDLEARPDLLPEQWRGRVATGIDCRSTPYPDGSLDAVVLDPPFREEFFRPGPGRLTGRGSHAKITTRYWAGGFEGEDGGLTGYEAMRQLYFDAGREAARILRPGGKLIVKCQDAVSSGRQRFLHVELVAGYERHHLDAEDLFVVVWANRPGVVRLKRQRHARKNHSYFLVFKKRTARTLMTRGGAWSSGRTPRRAAP